MATRLRLANTALARRRRKKSRGPSLDLGEDMDYDLALVENDGLGGDSDVPSSVNMTAATSSTSSSAPSPLPLVPSPSAVAPVQFLWSACRVAYAIGVLALVTGTTLTLSLWPHYPQYNMCSDEVSGGDARYARYAWWCVGGMGVARSEATTITPRRRIYRLHNVGAAKDSASPFSNVIYTVLFRFADGLGKHSRGHGEPQSQGLLPAPRVHLQPQLSQRNHRLRLGRPDPRQRAGRHPRLWRGR